MTITLPAGDPSSTTRSARNRDGTTTAAAASKTPS
jgi:hypothetical protein